MVGCVLGIVQVLYLYSLTYFIDIFTLGYIVYSGHCLNGHVYLMSTLLCYLLDVGTYASVYCIFLLRN